MILLPYVRALIGGATPLHVINKFKNREGASLLTAIYGILTSGHEPAMLAKPPNDEEMQKTIASKLEAGASDFIIDNLCGYMTSQALALATTCHIFEGRALGTNRMIVGNIDWTWILNGKNVQLASELSDRAVLIRLNSGKPRPELRDDFTHKNLVAWAKTNRSELVWACLTIIQNWIANGMPKDNSIRFGGFEAWAETMGGILRCAGIDGFMQNRADLDKGGNNRERDGVTLFLTAWDRAFHLDPHPNGVAVPVGDPESIVGTRLAPGEGGLLRILFEEDLALMKADGTDMDLSRGTRSAQTQLGDWLLVQQGGPHEIVRRWKANDGGAMRQTVVVAIERTTEPDDKGRGRARWRLTTLETGPAERDVA